MKTAATAHVAIIRNSGMGYLTSAISGDKMVKVLAHTLVIPNALDANIDGMIFTPIMYTI